MKSLSCFSILAVVFLLFASSAGAVDLATNATVDIIVGITITETTPMNFGVLALNDGTVVLSTAGTYTDATSMVLDPLNISQGIFNIDSQVGADVTVDCAAGVMPTGVALTLFTADWDGSMADDPCPSDRTMVSASEEFEIGASITIISATAVVTNGVPVNLPYTVSVTFQ